MRNIYVVKMIQEIMRFKGRDMGQMTHVELSALWEFYLRRAWDECTDNEMLWVYHRISDVDLQFHLASSSEGDARIVIALLETLKHLLLDETAFTECAFEHGYIEHLYVSTN